MLSIIDERITGVFGRHIGSDPRVRNLDYLHSVMGFAAPFVDLQ